MPSEEVQAHLSLYNVDVPKLLLQHPPIASYKAERVQQVTSFLAGLGLDVKGVVRKYCWVLAGKVEKYKAVVQLLQANKIDVVRVVNQSPSILSRRVASLQLLIDVIAGSGHSVVDVFHRHPGVHRNRASDISSTLQRLQARPDATMAGKQPLSTSKEDPRGTLLSSLGLDSGRVLKAPQLLGVKVANMRAVVEFLNGLGANVPKVVRYAPTVLTMQPETLQRRVQFLSENGLNVVLAVNGCPTMLCCSVEKKLRPIFNFVVQEMERPPSQLNGAYNLWCNNVKDRLRPRFLYLKSLGKSVYSLSQFGSLSDERFAVSLARTDLLHYYSWRRHHGYPVPPQYFQTTVDDTLSASPPVVDNKI